MVRCRQHQDTEKANMRVESDDCSDSGSIITRRTAAAPLATAIPVLCGTRLRGLGRPLIADPRCVSACKFWMLIDTLKLICRSLTPSGLRAATTAQNCGDVCKREAPEGR